MLKKLINKALIGVLVVLLPIAIIGSYQMAKTSAHKSKTDIYVLVDGQSTPVVNPDPLNPNSKAEIIVEVASEAKVGQLVRFDLSKSSGSQFKWKVLPSTTNFEIYEGGRKAVFSADAIGDYTFVVACALNGTVDVKTVILKVVSSIPGPTPTPTPTPTPNPTPPIPVPPTPTSTIGAKIAAWAGDVTAATKKADAIKLAVSFDTVAASIGTPSGPSTPEEIVAKTAASNRVALGTTLSAWVPFLTNLQAELKARAEAGTLVTPEQHAATWKDIANALRACGGA